MEEGNAMKQRVILGLFVMLAAGIFSCANPDSTKFSSAAAQGGLTEVELGRLVVQRASNPAVKSFGQQMIEDHSRAIKAFAAKTLPIIQRHLQMARDVANQVAAK